jgi:hypothetical protein
MDQGRGLSSALSGYGEALGRSESLTMPASVATGTRLNATAIGSSRRLPLRLARASLPSVGVEDGARDDARS